MIFDTDILIWVQRGNVKAAGLIEKAEERMISIYSYMEMFQCATAKSQNKIMHAFLREYDFKIQPLSEKIGHRAAIYIEEYALPSGLRAGDAIIAATAVENNWVLATSNNKHFKCIKDLQFNLFKP
ncbi:type II toxin-antitoxin system VapC family toxin [Coxiella burnetii]|uniref:type II toxin-antitoxin system VapC family toxin n=1 Tax=Coxiella burnetii TaxID=777 RepID=UPI000BFE947E|nr:type II toxin-antitoxin system VapC family toxin [Coxiella burnetii]PHH56901.1 VapC toxin family PIN domain ribonuclease [Coxiella burnetii]